MTQEASWWVAFSAGVLLSGGLFVLSARRGGFSVRRAAACFLCGILMALLAARLFHAAWYGAGEWFGMDPRSFSFAAGCAGFCAGSVLPCLRRREEIPALLDCLAVPGCVLVAFARFGEIFLGQLGLADVYSFGLPDIREGSLLARFPFAAADAWGYWYLSVSTLAALLALAAAAYGLWLKGKKKTASGVLFERCAVLLCSGRLFLELTRMESLIFRYVHLDQALCALFMLGFVIRACIRRKKTAGRFPVLPLVLVILCIAVNGVTQFLMDKPWMFEPVLPEGIYRWLNDNLKVFGLCLLLVTAVLPAVIHGRLCFGKVSPGSGTPGGR